jgi:hypothetical protein
VSDAYNPDLCRERHHNLDKEVDCLKEEDSTLHGRINGVIDSVNGKFTKLLYVLIGMLGLGILNLFILIIGLLKTHKGG